MSENAHFRSSIITESFKEQVTEAHRIFFSKRGINPDTLTPVDFATSYICPNCERMWYPKGKKECEGCGYEGRPFKPPLGM